LLSDGQIQSAYWDQVCRRTEVKIQIDTACSLWMLDAIEPPSMLTIDNEVDVDHRITDPTRNPCSQCVPVLFTHHQIGKPTRLMIVRENSRSFQMPFRILREQAARFMTWPVNGTPKNRLGYQGFLQKRSGIPRKILCHCRFGRPPLDLLMKRENAKEVQNDNHTISNDGNSCRAGRGTISAAS